MACESLLLTWPILKGHEEAWRRLMQEIQTFRQVEYTESRRRLGVRRECVHLAHIEQGNWAIITIEAESPENVLPRMAASQHRFDRWYVAQVRERHGIDLSGGDSTPMPQRIMTWQVSDGPVDNRQENG